MHFCRNKILKSNFWRGKRLIFPNKWKPYPLFYFLTALKNLNKVNKWENFWCDIKGKRFSFYLVYQQAYWNDMVFPQSFPNTFYEESILYWCNRREIDKLLNLMRIIASRGGISHKLKYPREPVESLAGGREGRTGRGFGQWKSLLRVPEQVNGKSLDWRAQTTLLDKELGFWVMFVSLQEVCLWNHNG